MTHEQNDTPAKTPVETVLEHAVDTLVYAPIGLLFEGASILPQLVEKGRSQVTMARMLGKFAVEQGRSEASKAASKLQDQAAGVLEFVGTSLSSVPAVPDEPAPTPSASRGAHRTAGRATKAPGAARQAARKVAGVHAAPAPAPSPAPTASGDGAASLAIPDYDGLSASHVVNRLAGLSAAELEAVRRYEAANRGRKTILSKVAQLQSA